MPVLRHGLEGDRWRDDLDPCEHTIKNSSGTGSVKDASEDRSEIVAITYHDLRHGMVYLGFLIQRDGTGTPYVANSKSRCGNGADVHLWARLSVRSE